MRGFLPAREEEDVRARVSKLDFHDFVLHGWVAKRRTCHFGYDYDPSARSASKNAEALPDWLRDLAERAARVLELDPKPFVASLVAFYPPGAQIGWHRDAPPFGPNVMGISLGSIGRMRFREGMEGRAAFAIDLEPGSLYLIGGDARSKWQHSMRPVRDVRYSITFRSMKRAT